MAKVELKQPIVDEISANLKDAKSAVLVQYLGLTVEQDTAMRKELREAGVIYKVYKNTLMKRAFEGTPYEALDKHLEGGNALAISTEDAVTPARILAKYVKQYKKFDFAAGVVEGTYYDGEQMVQVANIPSREILLSRLFGSMISPVGSFARVIKQIAGGDDEAPAEAPAAE